MLLNMLRGFTPQAALDAPRFCISAGSPESQSGQTGAAGDINSEVYFEEGISHEVVEKLKCTRSSAPSSLGMTNTEQLWDMMPASPPDFRDLCSVVDKSYSGSSTPPATGYGLLARTREQTDTQQRKFSGEP